MIQRIQSIYLLLAALSVLLVSWFFPLFNVNDSGVQLIDEPVFFGGFVFSGIISLFSIFRYKNRQQQVVSGRINIIINFITFGFMLYYVYAGGGEETNIQLGISAFLPVLAVIFIAMANRAIMRDEALVRAADRFR